MFVNNLISEHLIRSLQIGEGNQNRADLNQIHLYSGNPNTVVLVFPGVDSPHPATTGQIVCQLHRAHMRRPPTY